MKNTDLGDRIKALRGVDSRPIFAERFKVSIDTIARYENGQTYPGADFLQKLCNHYHISADWLIFGDEEAQLPAVVSQDVREKEKDVDQKYLQLPLVDTELAAGGGSFVDSKSILRYIEITYDIVKYKGPIKSLVFMSVMGDSMVPTLAHRDLVLINLAQTEPYSGGVFALAHDYGLYIKRLILEPGKLILRSDNSYYKDIILDLRDEATMSLVKIIGQAVWWCHDEPS